MTIKLFGELKHYELDYVVGKFLGYNVSIVPDNNPFVVQYNSRLDCTQQLEVAGKIVLFSPTTDWSIGGPIIEKYSVKNTGNLFQAMRDLMFSKMNEPSVKEALSDLSNFSNVEL